MKWKSQYNIPNHNSKCYIITGEIPKQIYVFYDVFGDVFIDQLGHRYFRQDVQLWRYDEKEDKTIERLNFSKQINSADDLRKFAQVFQQLKEDYHIENMATTLLVYDIVKRIRSGDFIF